MAGQMLKFALLLCAFVLFSSSVEAERAFLRSKRVLSSNTDNPSIICAGNGVVGYDIKMKIRNTRTNAESGWVPSDHGIGYGNTWCYNLTEHFSDLKQGDDFHTEVTANGDKDHADCHPHVNYDAYGAAHGYKVTGIPEALSCSS
mmetsp:Transcript_3009/g.3427  ORF Transcript_3009/g.3427 Transcript_3009/m.3427 type:complete len:145 (-) Transcript_3009:578-1012(-)